MIILFVTGIMSFITIWFNLRYRNAFISFIGLFSSTVFAVQLDSLTGDIATKTFIAMATGTLMIYHFVFSVKNSVEKRFINYG